MVENYQDGKQNKKGFNKLLSIIIAAAVLLIGGSVAAFVLIDKSPKANYFLYEKKTVDFLGKQVEDRYGSELEWSEKGLENPIEDIYEVSAQLNMQLSDSPGYITPEQILNNTTITITNQLDRKEKIGKASLKGSFGNFSIEDINFFITSEKVMLGLPFMNEILQLKGDDFGKLLNQADPMTFTGEESIDFDMFFNQNVLAEEDMKYIEDNYINGLYEALPDEAFTSNNEKVKIGDDNVDTEKITFQLSEKQVKDILKDTFTKMADDDRMKEIIQEYILAQGTSPIRLGESMDVLIPNFDEEYENILQEAITGLDSFMIPDGFTSTIWVNKDIIVKRDFSIELGPTEEELVTFYLNGTLNQNDTDVSLAYELGFVDELGIDYKINLDGELSNKKGEINDSLTLTSDTLKIIYESKETVDKSKKDFNRTFTLSDDTGYAMDLIWSGDAEYDGDQMKSNHEFTVAGDGIPSNAIVLTVNKESKVTDNVSLPTEEEVKDIGSLSLEELMTYFETEVTPQFEEWLMSVIGFGF
ncbi:hypothetical protein H8S33_11925 [Ornithinibacillus sp. BX22]|uniref:DUF945 domain-containing protein n=1 Tax=Ornithinibacillus hominis TaxID=2763055 RepID=A0A923L6T2_9BACI|nr:DUF6583 family protein [Ornithinibacillus hominis]MBC5637516.1 hypothetical protein [Ornithinibacillus hominis]